MNEREEQLEALLHTAEAHNGYLVAAVERLEGLSRLLRHKGSRFAGSHVADMIDRALSGVTE